MVVWWPVKMERNVEASQKSDSVPKPVQLMAIVGMFLPLVLAIAGVIPPSGDFFLAPWIVWVAAVLNAAFAVFYIFLMIRCARKTHLNSSS